jgi:hypothetical protein
MLRPEEPEPRKLRRLVGNVLFFMGVLILVPSGLCAGITALGYGGFFIFAVLALIGSALVYAGHKLVTRD